MTCVPTSLLQALRHELSKLGVKDLTTLGQMVRRDGPKVDFTTISINGIRPSQRHTLEFREHLLGFQEGRNGQEVSTFDPLLAFMALRTKVKIVHKWTYGRTRLIIEYLPSVCGGRMVTLYSNQGHMRS